MRCKLVVPFGERQLRGRTIFCQSGDVRSAFGLSSGAEGTVAKRLTMVVFCIVFRAYRFSDTVLNAFGGVACTVLLRICRHDERDMGF